MTNLAIIRKKFFIPLTEKQQNSVDLISKEMNELYNRVETATKEAFNKKIEELHINFKTQLDK